LISGEAVQIELKSYALSRLMLKFDQLKDIDDEFVVVWEHKTSTKTRTWSMSEYEFSASRTISSTPVGPTRRFAMRLYITGTVTSRAIPSKRTVSTDSSQTIGKVRATTNHQQEQAVAESRSEMKQSINLLRSRIDGWS
jgi:hypothetical protein